MDKKLNQKAWFTVQEAANYLSTIYKETITESDIYQYALDDILNLSINFTTYAYAKPGKIVPISKSKVSNQYFYTSGKTQILATEEDERLYMRYTGIETVEDLEVDLMPLSEDFPYNGDAKNYFESEDKVMSLTGIHDLPLIGNEKDIISKLLVQSKSGNDAEQPISFNMCGALASGEKGALYQIQEMISSNSLQHIEHDTETSIEIHKKFIPSNKFPPDSLIVIRTEEVSRFSHLLSEEVQQEKPLTLTQRAEIFLTDHEKKSKEEKIGLLIDQFGRYPDGLSDRQICKLLGYKGTDTERKRINRIVLKQLKK